LQDELGELKNGEDFDEEDLQMQPTFNDDSPLYEQAESPVERKDVQEQQD
jgi:hypothetical protein